MRILFENRRSLGDRLNGFLLALLLTRPNFRIVETGTLRIPGNWSGDGQSTLIFGNIVDQYGGSLYSYDISSESVKVAREATAGLSGVNIIKKDSITALTEHDKEIDLLYLDSLDFDVDNPLEAQEHQLRELTAAYDKLTEHAVVLLDDADLKHGGKARLTIKSLRSTGWICLHHSKQSVWTRP